MPAGQRPAGSPGARRAGRGNTVDKRGKMGYTLTQSNNDRKGNEGKSRRFSAAKRAPAWWNGAGGQRSNMAPEPRTDRRATGIGCDGRARDSAGVSPALAVRPYSTRRPPRDGRETGWHHEQRNCIVLDEGFIGGVFFCWRIWSATNGRRSRQGPAYRRAAARDGPKPGREVNRKRHGNGYDH